MCSFGYDDCVLKSVELFDEWMDSAVTNFEYNPIDPSIRATVYCKVNCDLFFLLGVRDFGLIQKPIYIWTIMTKIFFKI